MNCENIKDKRKKLIKIIKSLLANHKFDKKFAKKELAYWEECNGSYKAYCQVVINELRKYV